MPSYEYNKEYAKKYMGKLDEIKLRIPKGQKATVEAAAKAAGESINQYTQKALLMRMGLTEWPQPAEKPEE